MSRSPFRVAAVQMDCSGSLQEIEERAFRMVRRAAGLDARIVCLPEHWVPGGIKDRTNFLGPLLKAAKESQVYVVSGGDFLRKDGSTFVESFLLGPRGLVGSQRKVHLFGRENDNAKPGSRYSVLETDGVKVGIAICHDLVYPEVARIFALSGAEVIFSPAKIGVTGLGPWHLYVNARALENRIPVVSPNFLAPPKFAGGSVIVGVEDVGGGIVLPKVLARGGSLPRLLVADLDLKETGKLRRKRLGARRVETYAPLMSAGAGG